MLLNLDNARKEKGISLIQIASVLDLKKYQTVSEKINQLIASNGSSANHHIYVCWLIKSLDNQVAVTINNGLSFDYKLNTGTNEFEKVSLIHQMAPNSTHLMSEVRNHATSGWSEIQAKEPILLDLTEIYGAGNEPSLETIDLLIETIGWFEDKISIMEGVDELLVSLEQKMLKEINLKANKKQANWITPTLIGGVVTNGGFTPQYFKDEMGIVHFRGRVDSPANFTNAFILPAGYRPSYDTKLPVSANNAFGIVRIYPTEMVVIPASGALTEIDKVNKSELQELTQIDIVMLSIAELDTQRELDKLSNQLAIAELVDIFLRGGM